MQHENELTLRNMSVIAALAQNDKLMTDTEPFTVYMPTTVRGLVRFWYREARASNVAKIQSCIRFAKAFITSTLGDYSSGVPDNEPFSAQVSHQETLQFCLRMLDTLRRCVTGLTNLKQTYRDDITTGCMLQSLIDEIDGYVATTDNVMQSRAFASRMPMVQPLL
jgi:hypothetical protein